MVVLATSLRSMLSVTKIQNFALRFMSKAFRHLGPHSSKATSMVVASYAASESAATRHPNGLRQSVQTYCGLSDCFKGRTTLFLFEV
jgi:hypothetical protein